MAELDDATPQVVDLLHQAILLADELHLRPALHVAVRLLAVSSIRRGHPDEAALLAGYARSELSDVPAMSYDLWIDRQLAAELQRAPGDRLEEQLAAGARLGRREVLRVVEAVASG
jgi:hypothetical protein